MPAARNMLSAIAAVFALAACGGAGERAVTEAEVVSTAVFANASDATHLTGDQERPVPVETDAVGQFVMKLSKDGTSITYRLIASNIENVTMAHIHLIENTATGTGRPAVWLYPNSAPFAPTPIPGRSSGILSEGTITAANLVGPLAGQPLSALLAAFEAGTAYVNVHTAAHPSGEIRGDVD